MASSSSCSLLRGDQLPALGRGLCVNDPIVVKRANHLFELAQVNGLCQERVRPEFMILRLVWRAEPDCIVQGDHAIEMRHSVVLMRHALPPVIHPLDPPGYFIGSADVRL